MPTDRASAVKHFVTAHPDPPLRSHLPGHPVQVKKLHVFRSDHIDPRILVVEDVLQSFGILLHPVLRPHLQKENAQDLRNKGQHVHLPLSPVPVIPALVEAHIAAELPIVVDGALQHGFDSLRLHDGILLRFHLRHIPAVENAVFIKISLVSAAQVLQIPHLLEHILLGLDPGIAPFEGVAAAAAVVLVLKDVHPAHVQIPPHQIQDPVDGVAQIRGAVEDVHHIFRQPVFQLPVLFRINGRCVPLHAGEKAHLRSLRIKYAVPVLPQALRPVKGLVRILEKLVIGDPVGCSRNSRRTGDGTARIPQFVFHHGAKRPDGLPHLLLRQGDPGNAG